MALVVAGCAAEAPPAPPATPPGGMAAAPVVTIVPPTTPAPAPAAAAASPIDATKAETQVFQISFYKLELPQGAISSNEAFWKPFDESFLGPWQNEILHKNGLRVGRAPRSELKYLREQLDGAEENAQTLIGAASKDFEMEVRRDVAKQTIFYADRNGAFEGRDYEESDNLFAINFRRAPRHQDRVRISMSPMIRDQRTKLEADRTTLKVRVVQPQTLYDCNVTAELGTDECLVIAPASSALENPTSIGRIFMMEDRPAERVEKVLVIFPNLKASAVETTAAGRR